MTQPDKALPSFVDPRYVSYPLVLVTDNREVLRVDKEGRFTVSGVATEDVYAVAAALREWAIAYGMRSA